MPIPKLERVEVQRASLGTWRGYEATRSPSLPAKCRTFLHEALGGNTGLNKEVPLRAGPGVQDENEAL